MHVSTRQYFNYCCTRDSEVFAFTRNIENSAHHCVILFNCRRYVYKYVNDLETILGYSSTQIHKMMGIKPLHDEVETSETKSNSPKSLEKTNSAVSPQSSVYSENHMGKIL